jgi:hypothetical protein
VNRVDRRTKEQEGLQFRGCFFLLVLPAQTKRAGGLQILDIYDRIEIVQEHTLN